MTVTCSPPNRPELLYSPTRWSCVSTIQIVFDGRYLVEFLLTLVVELALYLWSLTYLSDGSHENTLQAALVSKASGKATKSVPMSKACNLQINRSVDDY